MSRDGTPSNEASEEDYEMAVERLRSELDVGTATDVGTPVSRTVDETIDGLFGDSQFEFEDSQVKASLDELLLALVAMRSSDTHGKQLLDDLAGDFDTALSPGTLYPRLHDLCEGGPLERRELVKTKEYTFGDEREAGRTIADAARQHLTLGMVFRAALERGDFE
ncbi:PadR family transcriptional regulator [Natronomonas amylolytica]|uniref:PadR family transcriptional regulator n=1 Tax=Natronomonas amylolytica TaxID=3108498 RepID=UPI0030099C9F